MSAKAKARTKPVMSTSEDPAAPEPAVFIAAPTDPLAEGSVVVEAPATETPPALPLVLRIKAATGKAVTGSFASARAAQATVVQRTLALVNALDEALGRSLRATEARLLTVLRVEPAEPTEA